MEVVLIALVVVIVLAGAGLVVTRRRREPTYEGALSAPPSSPIAAPPTAEDAEVVEAPPAEAAPVVEAPPVEEAPPAPVRPRFRDRLGKARGAVSGYLGSVLSRDKVEPATWDELEEALIVADVGVTTTTDILDRLRKTADEQSINDPEILLEALKAQL